MSALRLETIEEKMHRLTTTLEERLAEPRWVEKAIKSNLEGLGYGR